MAFSHLAMTAVAIELPSTLVAVRPMSRKTSMPMISSTPASGRPNIGMTAATTTSPERGTPAMPFDDTMRTSSIVTCCQKLIGMP